MKGKGPPFGFRIQCLQGGAPFVVQGPITEVVIVLITLLTAMGAPPCKLLSPETLNPKP